MCSFVFVLSYLSDATFLSHVFVVVVIDLQLWGFFLNKYNIKQTLFFYNYKKITRLLISSQRNIISQWKDEIIFWLCLCALQE